MISNVIHCLFPFFINFRHLALSFAPPLDIRKRPVCWSRRLGACSLASKLILDCFPKTVQYSFSWRKYRSYCSITWWESSLVIGWYMSAGCNLFKARYLLIYMCVCVYSILLKRLNIFIANKEVLIHVHHGMMHLGFWSRKACFTVISRVYWIPCLLNESILRCVHLYAKCQALPPICSQVNPGQPQIWPVSPSGTKSRRINKA